MKRTLEGRRVERIQIVLTGVNVTPLGRKEPAPTISFDDRNMKRRATGQDESKIISVVAAEYKIERVLIDQGSSVIDQYSLLVHSAEDAVADRLVVGVLRELVRFRRRMCPHQGTFELKTSFGERSDIRTILVLYTVVDAPASYNIIIGRLAINRLGAIVSTKHLCMKFPVGRRVGSVWVDSQVAQRCYEDSLRVERYTLADTVNALDLDLDPRGFRPEQTTKIGTAINPEEEDLLVTFLKANHDMFTWSPWDMPGMDPNFITGGKTRRSKEEKTRRREAQGSKKPSDKWRMCTNYTDLNKACPKDPYPLPSIDRLVDSVAGFALLSFMDAYSGYNQIRMHLQDEEKTTFITNDGAFCYKVMPFGLKNVGATYQRLMDKIFQGIMGADVEVYVDDMVVKSQGVAEHYEALGRVFHILRKHQLRLNPDKCSFGVCAGKFLGFMLTKRGIEANPEKCRAVTNMRSPQSVKEVQQFMGKVTALSRFISKAAETATPIFATLKKGGKFTWMVECEEAFLRLKAMMAAPLVLIRPSAGTPLYLYISVFDATVSSALIQEEEGEQRPIYFTSKVLQGAERRYQKIEKAALALVIAS
ncbi:Retrovirus-related Pol polyprotein from transposon opus, partial [Mucuna pruriens]